MRFLILEYFGLLVGAALIVYSLAGAVGVDTLTIINRVVEVLR